MNATTGNLTWIPATHILTIWSVGKLNWTCQQIYMETFWSYKSTITQNDIILNLGVKKDKGLRYCGIYQSDEAVALAAC